MTATGAMPSPAETDDRVEATVLELLLSLLPEQLTLGELQLELGGDEEGFACRDEIERAVRDLVAAGLLRRNGELVLPTHAACRFDRLLG